jgi:DNA-directed RNA polymerase alpha subunit
MPPRAEGESVAAYNKRANEEYEKQVILPSFDEDTREALLTARQLNSELEKFKGVWLVPQNRPRIKKIKSDLEKPKEALKDKIKGLRTELRKAPGLQSPEAKFIRFQIETLKNELGIIDKFLI